ncbi:MAG: energy transducer TonB [Nitrospirae bacterium]|nr:MAG: energy transducer TonB [Nitrospirota bacterium]
MFAPDVRPQLFLARLLISLIVIPLSMTGRMVLADEPADMSDESIETLDVIEVPATVIHEESRHIDTPMPDVVHVWPLPNLDSLPPPFVRQPRAPSNSWPVMRDPIADRLGILKPVRPTKAERPPYPLVAREEGWEGLVILRLHISAQGYVESITIRKSSGIPILDQSAQQTVKHWQFEPAKNGEFPVPATVDLPIRFDLRK